MRPGTGPGTTAPGALRPTALGTPHLAPPKSGRSGLIALAIVGGIGVVALAGGVLALFLWAQSRPEIPATQQAAGDQTPVTVPPLTQPPLTMPQPPSDTVPPDTLSPVTAPTGTLRPSPGTTRPTLPFGTVPPSTRATPEPVTTTTVATPPPPKRLGHPFKLGSPVGIPQMVSGPATLKSVVFKPSGEELQVEAEAKVDEGKDQKVTINVTLLDGDGRTVLKGQGTAGIDEGDTGKVKFKLKLGTVALGAIVGFEISVASVPD